jgi:putative endopeptidase
MTKQGQDKIGGYTPDQRFYLLLPAYVKWRRNFFVCGLITTHSPPIWRVNGPLMNSTPYNAFNVKPGDKMFYQRKIE